MCVLLFPQPAAAISYPSLDDQQPPAYDGGATVGTLIDLGSEITAPQPAPTGQQDIVSQLADMGVTGGQAPPTQSAGPEVEQSHDEFDMFAKSRTAYAGNTGYVCRSISLPYIYSTIPHSLSPVAPPMMT